MTANKAGASLYKTVNWNAIDWQKANQHVSQLQARIVKATREGTEYLFVKPRSSMTVWKA